jgi:hypothetical protein
MGVLYKAVHATQEMKRQAMIRMLLEMGVTRYKGRPVRELDYHEARHALVMARLKKEGN